MTTTAQFTVKPRSSNDDASTLEFVVEQSDYTGDLGAPWYTVVVRNANQGSRRRYAVWSGSPLKAGTMRPRSAMSVHAITHQEVVKAVKAYLAAQ